jgi:two-component system, response regulator PdtaR
MTHVADNPTVLVVDDEPLLRMFVCDVLEEAGYEAVGAGSADEAIELLRGGKPFAAVVKDIEMPGAIDGLELAWNIQANWPGVAVVVTSGRKLPRPEEMPRAASFLPKPFSAERLVDTMAQLR